MKFIAYRHQTREVHENDHLMINMTASLTFHLERKPISCPGTPLDVRHTNGFPCQSKGMAITLATNASLDDVERALNALEEDGVWRGPITPARRLKLAAEKGNHRRMEVQQGSKMDVSDKKEQRKESELDERWLKLTTKGTPKKRP